MIQNQISDEQAKDEELNEQPVKGESCKEKLPMKEQ